MALSAQNTSERGAFMAKLVTGTPYDDVFRTLLDDCTSLIIPVINEVFGEHFNGSEEIIF